MLVLILFTILIQTLVQEIEVSTYVFLEAERTGKRFSFVIYSYVERLGIGAKLACLQVAPLVADGAKGALLAVELYFHWLWQWGLVVYIE